ncbi:MAG: DUF4386 domain-containing protein [Gammaproteobacteria bacterium]
MSQNKMDPNKTARIAGLLYVLLIPLGVFGIMYIPSTLIVPGDAAATASKIIANESAFRFSIVSALLTQLVNLWLVLFLYKLLKPVNKNYAVLMVVFIMVAVPIAMVNELNNIAVLMLLSNHEYLSEFSSQQLQALVPFFLDLHESGINLAGIFWGLWLFPMGYLVYKSGFIPKLIGVLLVIACVGYLLDSFIYFIIPNVGFAFSEYLFFGEIAISFWLLIKGVDIAQWEKYAV